MSYQDSNAYAKTYNLADHASFVDVRGEVGVTLTVGTPSVTVLNIDSNGNVRSCTGATVPSNGDAGYATGCVFVQSSGGSSTTFYVNQGTSTSAAFASFIAGGTASVPVINTATASLGTVQNSTPTAAQLLGGIVTQTTVTGAGTVTLPTGTLMSAANSSTAIGDSFTTTFANLGGTFTLTVTGATGMTVVGNAAVASGKNALFTFVCTAANTWSVYVTVSA